MDNIVEDTIETFREWEQILATFLSERLSPEIIEHCLSECRKDIRAFSFADNEISPSLREGVVALSKIRELLKYTEQPLSESIPLLDAAHLVLLSFNAGLYAGMCGPGRGIEVFSFDNKRLRKGPSNAANARHKKLKEFKEHAGRVAKSEWEKGSPLKHHRMRTFLVEEYEEGGRFPFAHLPDAPNDSSDQVLLDVVKQVAKDMDRPDLISGQKKSSQKRLPPARIG